MTLRSYVDAAPLPDHVSGEMWELDAARWRLDTLRSELPVAVPRTAEFIGGASNDAWMFGDLVLRVCWRADRDRMVREARLLDALPDTIPHAPVLGFGRTEELSWVLSGRVRGKPLDPGLPTPVLRGLFDELAAILAALHAWTPPPEIAALLHDRPQLDLDEPLSVWAADLVAMPIASRTRADRTRQTAAARRPGAGRRRRRAHPLHSPPPTRSPRRGSRGSSSTATP